VQEEVAVARKRRPVAQELRRRKIRNLARYIFRTHILRLAAFITRQGSLRVRGLAGEDHKLVGDAVEVFLERYGIPFESERSGKKYKGRRIRVLDVPALRRLLASEHPDYFVRVLEEVIEELQAKYVLEGRIHGKKRRRKGAPPFVAEPLTLPREAHGTHKALPGPPAAAGAFSKDM